MIEDTWAACGWCGRLINGQAHELAGDAVANEPARGGIDDQSGNEPPGVAADDVEVTIIEPPEPEAPEFADDAAAHDGIGEHESVELPGGTLLLGRYRTDAVLGRGGFGITYRARDTRLHRDVAIKELFPPAAQRRAHAVCVDEAERVAYDGALARFQREAASLARFNHPGIVRIFEVFEENNTAYLVMELIEGQSVGEVLRSRGIPFEVDDVLDLVQRVGGALEAVHDAGLLHRDINPSNLMVDGDRRIVLIDFGLARRFGDDISGSVTRAVTPGYAPPEQYAGSALSGPPCDVFGLAATAYKLLTGTTPTNVFDRQSGVPLPAPAALCPEIPALVSAAILDGMELDPGHRPATPAAFLNRLGLYGTEPAARVRLGAAPSAVDATVAGRVVGEVGDAEPGVRNDAPSPSPSDGFDSSDRVVPLPQPLPLLPKDLNPSHGVNAPASSPTMLPTPRPDSVVAGGASATAPAEGPINGLNPVGVPSSPQPIGQLDRPVASKWRGWVTWPVAISLVALTSASPLVVGSLIGFGILPALATAGDVDFHRRRLRMGAQSKRWHSVSIPVISPVRFLRNLIVGMVRAIPAAAIGAGGYVAARMIGDGPGDVTMRAVMIRLCGAAMALLLVVPARHGAHRFRTDVGITMWADWVMEGRRRPGIRTVVAWVIALAGTALGIWLNPDLWPLT